MFHVREPGFDLILAEPIITAPDITARQLVDVFSQRCLLLRVLGQQRARVLRLRTRREHRVIRVVR